MDIDGRLYCSRCLREIDGGVCPHCGHVRSGEANKAPALGVGVLLEGRYQLGMVIGQGGFGITYAAWDELLQTPVAVKEYFPQTYASRENAYSDEIAVPEERRREYLVGMDQFLREARVLAMLKSMPGAVNVQDFFEENGTAYIVMDFLRGQTLAQYAAEHRLTAKQLLTMLRPAVDALTVLHGRGVMHRDITPNNFMVLEDGGVRLIDLGSAGMMDRTQALTFATDCYAPIEQYEAGGDNQGAWTDVYGLCATIYSVLTGCTPQPAPERKLHDEMKPISAFGVRLRGEQARALNQGLSLLPEDRQQSMTELRAALYGISTPEELRRRRAYRRKLASLFAALMLLGAAVAVNFTLGLPLGGGLTYAVHPDGLHVVRALETQAVMEIPGSRFGLPVSAVKDRAFMGNETLERLTIPGSVRGIGHMAFAQCEGLELVTLGDGVEQVGEFAFASCPQLHTVHVPASVASLSAGAFDGASPQFMLWGERGSHAHQIASDAQLPFADANEYDAVPVEGGMMITACRSADARLVLPSYIDGALVVALQDEPDAHVAFDPAVERIIFPEALRTLSLQYVTHGAAAYMLSGGTRRIEERAFSMARGRGIQGISITLEEGLEEIGDHAFFLCGLEEIILPSTIRVIGNAAFDCADLIRVTIPDTDVEFGKGVFAYTDLISVEIPGRAGLISDEMFQYCSELESVTIGEGIARIGSEAFYKCERLESVCLPSGVEFIGSNAFAYCTRMKYIDIPQSVTQIGDGAFDGCSSMLVIGGYPGSEAQRYAQAHGLRFEDKSAYTAEEPSGEFISSIYFSPDMPELICPSYSTYGRTLITTFHGGEGAKWERVVLPAFTETIGVNAFTDNVNLREIELPKSLRQISFHAFEGCTALEEVMLPVGLEQIEWNAFAGCTALRAAHLPPTVAYLGTDAFRGCTALEEITISEGLSSLDELVFAMTGVKSVRVPGNVRTCRLSFYGCSRLEEIVFEEGVRELYAALQQCASLRSVTLPASMKTVSRGTLRGCTALEDVYILSMDADLDGVHYESISGEIIGLEDSGYIPVEEGSGEPPLFADCPGVTIHAYEGSTAQAYALAHGLAFEPLEAQGL